MTADTTPGEKPVRIKAYCHTGYPGADYQEVFEVPANKWSSMSEKDREDYLEDLAQSMLERIDHGAYVMDDDEDDDD